MTCLVRHQCERRVCGASTPSKICADLKQELFSYHDASTGPKQRVSKEQQPKKSARSSAADASHSQSLLERMNARQRQAAQRLEAKRKEAEQERLAEVKDKPDINDRSRKLASRRTAGKDIATRGAQAQAAKEDKTQRMRAALEAREAAQIQSAPSINPSSRKMVRDGRSMDRMLAWEAEKQAKLQAAREAAAAKETAQLRSKVAVGQQSRRILSMKQERAGSDASSRLYSLGVQRQQSRREDVGPPPTARSSSAARSGSRGSIYERSRAASAAREVRLQAQRGETLPVNKAASAPRPRSRRPLQAGRAASPGAPLQRNPAPADASEPMGAIRSRLFQGRASSAPRSRREPSAGAQEARAAAYGAFGRRGNASPPGLKQRAPSPARAPREPTAAAAPPVHGVALAGGWFQYVDKTSQKPYFFHPPSNTVTWQRPATAAPPQPEQAAPPPAAAAASPAQGDTDWLQSAGGQFASRFAAVAASLVQP